MLNINQDSFFSSFLPELAIKKIVLEKNNGFYKSISNPHISSSLERETKYSNNQSFNLSLSLQSRTKIVSTNKQYFIDLKTLSESTKIGVFVLKQFPPQGFQKFFEDNINNDDSQTIRNWSLLERQTKLISDFESESISDINNINFLSRDYSFESIRYGSEPTNLYIVYGTFVELPEKFKNDFGFDATIFSPVRVETVLQDGSLKSTSSIYFIKDTEQIWPGKFSVSGGVFQTVEQNPRELEEYKINNYKIQDFRIQSKIEQEKINFKQNNEELLSTRIRQLIPKEPKRKVYFSDIFLSNRESCNFFFTLNMKQLIKDNCKFSKIYEDLDLLFEDIFRKTTLLSFKVLRRRVGKSGLSTNKLTDERSSYKFDNIENEKTIVHISNKNVKDLISTDTIKQIYSCVNSLNDNFIYFVQDRELSSKTDGEYQYGVEIELSDPTNEIIIEDIKKIQIYRNIFKLNLKDLQKQQVYTTNQKLENFEKEIFYSDPHIEDTQRQRILREVPVTVISEDQQISEAIELYFQILSKYYVSLTPDKLDELKNILKAQSSYFARDTKGLENFINLCDKLIADLQELADDKIFVFDDPHVEGQSGNVRNRNKQFYGIKHYFTNDVADANYLDFKNVNYLEKKGVGFNLLTANEFENFISRQRTNGTYITDRQILPFSINQSSAGKTPSETTRLYDKNSLFYSQKLKEDLLRHVNVSINSVRSENNIEQEQFTSSPLTSLARPFNNLNIEANRQEEEKRLKNNQNNSTISSFLEYCAKNIVKNKNIDQVVELYEQGNTREFVSKLEFLSLTEDKSLKWISAAQLLSSINSLITAPRAFLLCKFTPIQNDYRNKNWMISKEMNYTDNFFIVSVSTSAELQQIFEALSPSQEEQGLQEPIVEPQVDINKLLNPNQVSITETFTENVVDVRIVESQFTNNVVSNVSLKQNLSNKFNIK